MYKDGWTAAEARAEALERELDAARGRAAIAGALERENEQLRSALAQARRDLLPRDARWLAAGVAGAFVLGGYLLVTASLTLIDAPFHVPLVSCSAFCALLLGFAAFCRTHYDSYLPVALLGGLFVCNQLTLRGNSDALLALQLVSWTLMMLLASYTVWRAARLPRRLALITTVSLMLTAAGQVALTLLWQPLLRRGIDDAAVTWITVTTLGAYLLCSVLLGACLWATRNTVLRTTRQTSSEGAE